MYVLCWKKGKRILMYCLILCFIFCFMFTSCSSVLLFVRWQLILLQGGVGLRIRVYDRKMCFVSNHFAAHLEAVSRRNADFDHIYRTMAFNKPHGSTGSCFTFFEAPFFSWQQTIGVTNTVFILKKVYITLIFLWCSFRYICPIAQNSECMCDLTLKLSIETIKLLLMSKCCGDARSMEIRLKK